MSTSQVSAVLFARDQGVVAAFYQALFGATIRNSNTDYTALSCAGFELTVHQIPRQLLPALEPGQAVQRRERSAVRLDFPVADPSHARREAHRLGGSVDDRPPPWAGNDQRFFLGQDPEGNVFGVKVRP
jgi:predicted enzyme related to lactoylglutathione lyase